MLQKICDPIFDAELSSFYLSNLKNQLREWRQKLIEQEQDLQNYAKESDAVEELERERQEVLQKWNQAVNIISTVLRKCQYSIANELTLAREVRDAVNLYEQLEKQFRVVEKESDLAYNAYRLKWYGPEWLTRPQRQWALDRLQKQYDDTAKEIQLLEARVKKTTEICAEVLEKSKEQYFLIWQKIAAVECVLNKE